MSPRKTPVSDSLGDALAALPKPSELGTLPGLVKEAEALAAGLAFAGVVKMDTAHYSAVELLARYSDGPEIAKAEAMLDQLDELHAAARDGAVHSVDRDLLCPSDAAAQRWSSTIHAAYVLGVAIGHRLAGGVR